MLSARQRREAWNVELVQGLTWINLYYFAGKRDSFSPALGLGLLSQLHLVVPLKPSRRHSNDAHLHIAASRPGDRRGLLAAAHESVFGNF
jgi:hypothetical protein